MFITPDNIYYIYLFHYFTKNLSELLKNWYFYLSLTKLLIHRYPNQKGSHEIHYSIFWDEYRIKDSYSIGISNSKYDILQIVEQAKDI